MEGGVGEVLEMGVGSSNRPLLRVSDLGQSQPTQGRVEQFSANSKLLPHSREPQECVRKKTRWDTGSLKIQTRLAALARSVSALRVSKHLGTQG